MNIHVAKTHRSRLVDQAAAGEAIIIARTGKPVARLVKLVADGPKPPRMLGTLVIADDFDAPLPDEILDLFEGR